MLMPTMGIGFIAYMTFIFAMQLPWAFRGDIDHIDVLKSLPVAPLALAAGELAGGVLVLAAIQFVVLAALLVANGDPAMIMTAAAFLVPFDVMMLGVSNVLFLIYPVRMVQIELGRLPAHGPADALHAASVPDPDSQPGHSGGDRRNRLLAERFLLAGIRRHFVAGAHGRIAAALDLAGVGISAV